MRSSRSSECVLARSSECVLARSSECVLARSSECVLARSSECVLAHSSECVLSRSSECCLARYFSNMYYKSFSARIHERAVSPSKDLHVTFVDRSGLHELPPELACFLFLPFC